MLVFAAPPLGFPVLRLLSCVCMPSSLPRQDGWKLFARTLPVASAFPTKEMGRLLHCGFRGLLNVHSHYSLHTHGVAYTTLSTEGFSRFVASTPASVVTGWNEPVPGRVYLPLKSTAFPRRTPSTPRHQALWHAINLRRAPLRGCDFFDFSLFWKHLNCLFSAVVFSRNQ